MKKTDKKIIDLVLAGINFVFKKLTELKAKKYTYNEFINRMSKSIDEFIVENKSLDFHGGYFFLKINNLNKIIMEFELYSKKEENWIKQSASKDVTNLLDEDAINQIKREKEIKIPIEEPNLNA